MADIFREVDEEVRAERARALWRKYGVLVVGAAVLAVLAVGGFQLWKHMQAEAAAEASLRLEEALALAGGDEPADAAAAFAALAAEGGGAGLLARFGEAAMLARQGDAGAALAGYAALAADEDAAPVYRDLARLFQGMTELDAGRPEAAITVLESLSGPLRYSAAETVAAARATLGETTAAVAGFKALADDPDAPAGVRRRSSEMLAALGDAS
ncbi:MAG: tetratricopeptide repeat protein [Alphaproteobacteria bacterium]|nr:tetratricopeptide repeat protein [Alphaproteobacteria bacterium]MCY4319187.1 tetratricopeptide repeat protein [Alphaproteobacteria bacterium]